MCMENKQTPSTLVAKELPPMWILWAYVDVYQQDGKDFNGSHTADETGGRI